MPDARFFESLGPLALGELAALSGAAIDSGFAENRIIRAATLTGAEATDVAFAANRKHLADVKLTRAGACFVPTDLASEVPEGCIPLVTKIPHGAWSLAANALHRAREHAGEGPSVHPSARLEEDVVVSMGAVVGEGAEIGRGTRIGPGAVIGPGVAIGRDCLIGPRAVIGFALVGDRVKIYSGAVVGEAGFGATAGPGGVIDIPQLGRVILQDNVTIGANSCVDRGAWEDTVVGENTKLDNLVHIAHNVRVGRNCVMAAYTGISGSVTIGDGAAFGGRAGVADHVTIGDGAQIAAAAGLFRDVPAGETWAGFPAQPSRDWFREVAWIRKSMKQGRKGDA